MGELSDLRTVGHRVQVWSVIEGEPGSSRVLGISVWMGTLSVGARTHIQQLSKMAAIFKE